MRLVRFIARDGEYRLPAQSSGLLTFGEVVPSTKKLAGMSGGFDEYRGNRSPSAIGNVRAEWWINPNSKTYITDQKDDANAMLGWGKGLLFVRPENALDVRRDVRFARARINNIQMPENVANLPHLRQQATGQWQVSDPAWYGIEPNSLDPSYNLAKWWYMDDGLYLDAGLTMGGPRRTVTIANGGTITVINNGSHATRPKIRITGVSTGWVLGGVGVILGVPTLYFDGPNTAVPSIGMRRISYASGDVIEEWKWFGAVNTTDVLEVNSDQYTVTLETTTGNMNAYSGFQVTKGFGFFEIPPGTHTLQIFGTFTSTAAVTVDYFDAWY